MDDAPPRAPKFAKGDRVRIVEKLFPSYDEGLFKGLPKTGVVVEVNAGSILPCRVSMDTFAHHTFWFYENQLAFEDEGKEKAWEEANKPQVKSPPPKPGTPA